MMLYRVMLCLFIFGFVAGGINESGLYSTATVPYSNVEITENDVTDLTGGVGSGAVNALFIISALVTFGKILGSAFVALLTILPILLAFKMPVWLALMFQGPVWLVEIWGLYEFYTGHQTIGMD